MAQETSDRFFPSFFAAFFVLLWTVFGLSLVIDIDLHGFFLIGGCSGLAGFWAWRRARRPERPMRPVGKRSAARLLRMVKRELHNPLAKRPRF